MANRNFHRLQALEIEVKHLHALAAIGSSGAVTLDAVNSKGIQSIVRNSAGQYTITLSSRFNRLLDFHALVVDATAQDITCQVLSETVATNRTITIGFFVATTATDLSSGASLRLKIELKNSSAQ